MSGAAIRDKLYDYIRVADEKKLKAIYSLLEDEITETQEWWKEATFINELDKRVENWESGKEKAYSIAETKQYFEELKTARSKSSVSFTPAAILQRN